MLTRKFPFLDSSQDTPLPQFVICGGSSDVEFICVCYVSCHTTARVNDEKEMQSHDNTTQERGSESEDGDVAAVLSLLISDYIQALVNSVFEEYRLFSRTTLVLGA